ncbi:hypothetical protein Drorol1_Dr00003204 [Drosera rotundifolia]
MSESEDFSSTRLHSHLQNTSLLSSISLFSTIHPSHQSISAYSSSLASSSSDDEGRKQQRHGVGVGLSSTYIHGDKLVAETWPSNCVVWWLVFKWFRGWLGFFWLSIWYVL